MSLWRNRQTLVALAFARSRSRKSGANGNFASVALLFKQKYCVFLFEPDKSFALGRRTQRRTNAEKQ